MQVPKGRRPHADALGQHFMACPVPVGGPLGRMQRLCLKRPRHAACACRPLSMGQRSMLTGERENALALCGPTADICAQNRSTLCIVHVTEKLFASRNRRRSSSHEHSALLGRVHGRHPHGFDVHFQTVSGCSSPGDWFLSRRQRLDPLPRARRRTKQTCCWLCARLRESHA